MANSHVFNLLTAGSKSYVPLLRGCTGTEGGRGPRGGIGPRGLQGPAGPEGAQGPEVSSEYFSKRLIDQFNGFTPLYEGITIGDGVLHQVALQFDVATMKSFLKTCAEAPNSILPFVWYRDEADPDQWTIEFKGVNDQTLSTCSVRCPDQEGEDILGMTMLQFKDVCAYELGNGSVFEFTPGVPHFVMTNPSTPPYDNASSVERTSFFGLRPGFANATSSAARYSGQYFIHCRREAMNFEHYNDTELCIHGVDGTYPRVRFSKISSYFHNPYGSSPASGFKRDVTYSFTRLRSVSTDSYNSVAGFSSPIPSILTSPKFPFRIRRSSSDDPGVTQTRSPLAFRRPADYEMADPPFDFDGVPSITRPLPFYTWNNNYSTGVWTSVASGSETPPGFDPAVCGYFYCRTVDNSNPFGGGGESPGYLESEATGGSIAIVVPALREGFFLANRAVSANSITSSIALLDNKQYTIETWKDVIMLVRFDAFRRPWRFIFLVFSLHDHLNEFVMDVCNCYRHEISNQTEVTARNLAATPMSLPDSAAFTIVDVEQRDTVNLSVGSAPVDSAVQHPDAVATVDFVTQYVQGVLA